MTRSELPFIISRTSSPSAIAALWLLPILACHAPPQPAAPTPAETPPAGTVEHLEGHVAALRSGTAPPRILAAKAAVWADDTVTTAPDASVGIRLLHNGALWELQGGQTRRVDQGLAWKAGRSVQAVALADRAEAPATASAGRHSEQEAAQSAESAARPLPAPTPAPSPVQRAKPPSARRGVPEASSPVEPQATSFRKATKYDFDDDTVTGELRRPSAELNAPPPPPPPPPPPAPPREALERLGLGEKSADVDGASTAPAVMGSLSRESVQRFLKPVRHQMQQCYARVLKQDPTASGKLMLRIEFGADGRVALVTATSETLPPEVGTCVEALIKRRPKSAMKSVSVQFPMVFKAQD